MADVIVIGAGPAGVFAAGRAAELGANTTLIARDEFGGMAANDGPVPVRTLAHAVRLIREASQLSRYGIAVSEPVLSYPRLLARVREVVDDVRAHSLRREYLDQLGVTTHEKAGTASFVDPHTIETDSGLRLQADRIIICAGGTSRRLPIPGFELTATHSDAWGLNRGPAVDVGRGRRSDRGAGRLDLQRFRLTRAALPGRPAHPDHRGRRRVGGSRGRLPRIGHRGARELRHYRSLREDARRRTDGVFEGRQARQRRSCNRGRRGWVGCR